MTPTGIDLYDHQEQDLLLHLNLEHPTIRYERESDL